jgi:hypothetical protein
VDPPPPPVPPPPPNEPPPPPPPGPSGNADLIVTSLTPNSVTVKNQGTAATGSFTTTVYENATARASVPFAGLSPGASSTMSYTPNGGTICGATSWSAVADSSNVVPESNEGNNTRTNFDEPVIC